MPWQKSLWNTKGYKERIHFFQISFPTPFCSGSELQIHTPPYASVWVTLEILHVYSMSNFDSDKNTPLCPPQWVPRHSISVNGTSAHLGPTQRPSCPPSLHTNHANAVPPSPHLEVFISSAGPPVPSTPLPLILIHLDFYLAAHLYLQTWAGSCHLPAWTLPIDPHRRRNKIPNTPLGICKDFSTGVGEYDMLFDIGS